MLVQPGTLISAAHAGRDPILSLQNLNHYSDPSLSGLEFHSGVDLKEILPIKGSQKMEQPDPAYAMQYIPEAFNGLGGYGFPETNRFMMYDADPVPFQVGRTIGIVVSTPGPFNNDQIFGLTKFSAFNTHWRVSTSTVTGGRIYIFALILEVPVAYFYEGLPDGAIKDLSFSEENKWAGTKEEDIFLQKDVLQFAQNYVLLKATDSKSAKLLKQFLQSLVEQDGGDQ